ncbi:Protein involved in beta-1,3-glucan synthesis [Bacillus mycoides]|nr:Protein involved in beta-1,3-glucan synthesis [Bacillus mycoides]
MIFYEEEDVSYLLEYQDDKDAVDSKINPKGLLPGTYIHFSDSILILTLLMKVYVVK